MPRRKRSIIQFDGFARIMVCEIGGKVSITFELEKDKADKFLKLLKQHEAEDKKT